MIAGGGGSVVTAQLDKTKSFLDTALFHPELLGQMTEFTIRDGLSIAAFVIGLAGAYIKYREWRHGKKTK